MPIVCINRPNRSERRVWTAKAVGRVCSYAVREGATREELRTELEPCLPQCNCELIDSILNFLLGLLAGALIADLIILERSAVFQTLRFLSRFVKILVPLVLYLERLSATLSRIQALAEQARAEARRGTGIDTGG